MAPVTAAGALPPNAFAEQGVAMVSSVLDNPRAIAGNIEIVHTIVLVRQLATTQSDPAERSAELGHKTEGLWLNHDTFRRRTRSQLKVQLAKALGVSQQTVQAYEVSRRRIPVSTLRLLAKTLDVSLDELMAEGQHAPRKRGPVPQVQRQLERISALPKPKQRAVMDVIEALLAQQGR